ncbi:stage III sporulation protein AE [Paenibacillus alkalitolerans]|uniref:stage III sporulation protein AE n=1 Tax=Paenibacillus alkalitolerans TaxID=2799335 RepID=UPI0018F6DA82|nr:stage III sporulation protein AE [Paenibacillus alkalitolerans]
MRKAANKGLAVFIFLFLAVFAVSFTISLPANAMTEQSPDGATEDPSEAVDEWVRSQADLVPTDEVEKYWDTLMRKYGGWFPDGNPSFQEAIMPGGKGFSLSEIGQGLFSFALHELVVNGKLLALIVILTVFSIVLETLQSAFEKTTVSKIAFAITYMVLAVLAINSFNVAIGYAKDAISGMIHFMMAVIPVVLTMLASLGNVATVSILHPLIVFMIHTVGNLIYFFVFPLLFFSAVLHIVSTLTDKYKVTQLAQLLRTVALGTLTVALTVFLGVISVQGATGGVADGVTLKTAKYVTGNFVPVVGRMFSDATDTVLSASLLLKNAVGIVGVVIIVMLCAFPALKIIVLAFIFNVGAALLQPLGDSPIIECLQTIGKSMIYVFAALATVGLMFFLAITIIIAAGNVSVMIR